MADVTITRISELTSPELRAHADKIANAIIAAGCKAAAHEGDPTKYTLPPGESLERSFLNYVRARPIERRKPGIDKCLPLVRDRQLRGFHGVDVAGAQPVMNTILAGVKIAPLVDKTNLVKRVLPVLEAGKPGFRLQGALDRLQFRLTNVKCVDETDGFAGSESGSDEISVGGMMIDAAGTSLPIPQVDMGDFVSDGVTKNVDILLGELDFRGGQGWPKKFQIVLVLIERDNGGFPEFLNTLLGEVRKEIIKVLADLGNAIAPIIGEAIAAAVGWILDKVFTWIKEIWEDDLFPPCPVGFNFASADDRWSGSNETAPLLITWTGHGGKYEVSFKARLVLESLVARQDNWRYCNKCEGLHFGGNTPGVCPAGGGHITTGSSNYALGHNSPGAPGQGNWRYCSKCEGLHYGGNAAGVCPAGGGHVTAGSGDYTLPLEDSGASGQANWRYCSKCEGLHFGGNTAGVCPAGGGHVTAGSGNYTLFQR
jgi:hypothetical protein